MQSKKYTNKQRNKFYILILTIHSQGGSDISNKNIDKYSFEREGQIDFYTRFLPRVDPILNIDDIIADSNDGVLLGSLIEFKSVLSDYALI